MVQRSPDVTAENGKCDNENEGSEKHAQHPRPADPAAIHSVTSKREHSDRKKSEQRKRPFGECAGDITGFQDATPQIIGFDLKEFGKVLCSHIVSRSFAETAFIAVLAFVMGSQLGWLYVEAYLASTVLSIGIGIHAVFQRRRRQKRSLPIRPLDKLDAIHASAVEIVSRHRVLLAIGACLLHPLSSVVSEPFATINEIVAIGIFAVATAQSCVTALTIVRWSRVAGETPSEGEA